MPLPAGTGLSRRSFLSRSAGLALAVYGGSALGAAALDDGIAAAAAATPANQKVLVSIFLNGGIDALNVLFPAGDPAYYSLRPTIAIGQTRARRSSRTTGCAGIRRRAASRRCTRRARSRCSSRSGTTTRTSRISRRGTTTRSAQTDAHLRTGWLGRYLDKVGTADNPVQGLTLDATLHPALATAKMPVATLLGADQYVFGGQGVAAHPLEASMLQMAANIGAAHKTSPDPGLKQAGGTAYDSHHLYYELGNFKYGFASPVAYPSVDRSVPEAARRARGDARRGHAGARGRADGRSLRHARRPGRDAQPRPRPRRRLAALVPARPRGARPRRPRARARLVGVRPARGRERLRRHRPRRRRHRVPDRHAG